MTVIMKCGHAANGTNQYGQPVCVICVGLTGKATEVDPASVNLEGRLAKCCYCGVTVPSSTDLPFFRVCLDREFDDFYSGCRGWD